MIDFVTEHWLQIVGVVLGLLYLILEYKASIWMWLAGMAMTLFYIVIFFDSQLYASMGIYIYFLIMSIYGWGVWILRNKKAKEDTAVASIKRMPIRYLIYILVAIALVAVILFFILDHFTLNVLEISIGDAVTTSLNIIALYMAAQKWAEQWLLLIPANLISAMLLFHQNDHISGILFIVYFVSSIFGFFNWKKLAKEKEG